MKIFNLINATQAHQIIQKIWHEFKPELIAGNKQVIIVKSFEESMTAQQRKYYHGHILQTISRQVSVDGKKYNLESWKEYFRAKFLGDEVIEVTDIKTGAIKKELRRVSSESLSVAGYSKLIEQVTAEASTEYGVVFTNFDDWMEAEIANEG
jgi:ATP-dependent Lon protease